MIAVTEPVGARIAVGFALALLPSVTVMVGGAVKTALVGVNETPVMVPAVGETATVADALVLPLCVMVTVG